MKNQKKSADEIDSGKSVCLCLFCRIFKAFDEKLTRYVDIWFRTYEYSFAI